MLWPDGDRRGWQGMGLETDKTLHFRLLRFEVTRCLSETMSHIARDGGLAF